MTIENSEDTAHVGVTGPVEPSALEHPSGLAESSPEGTPTADPASGVIESGQAVGTHDSSPPVSRKLAPPPKPKRDSGAASAPPSGRPPGEGPDLLASASALKAPIAPTISFSADGEPTLDSPPLPAVEALPEVAPTAAAPLSQPPPIPRRRSNPSIADSDAGTRTPSDPALGPDDSGVTKAVSNAPRPIAVPPRPRSDPPGPRLRSDSSPGPLEREASVASAPPPVAPTSPAIFAMRIIAVGDSVRPPAAQEPTPDIDPDSYPPSASRLGTTVRRSSRPVIASAGVAAAPVAVPPAAPVPSDLGPQIEVDVMIDVELPPARAHDAPASEVTTVAAPRVELASVDIPIDELPLVELPAGLAAPVPSFPAVPTSIPLEARRPPAPPPPVELSDDQFSAEAIAKKIAAAEAAEAAEAARLTAAVPPAAMPAPSAAMPAPSAAMPASSAAMPASPAAMPAPPAAMPAPPAAEPARAAVEPAQAADAPAQVVGEPVRAAASPAQAAAEPAANDAEELGREDAISMPPEEVAALQAEMEAKADAAKPPPPPKRAAGAAPSGIETAPVSGPPPKETPPTPDPAAAKAAQRAKTRQPWWEDLFNEDFMRASARVSDEHIRREVTFIEESLGVAAGGVVLDLGCGAGHHAVEFASRGYGVVGYDLSLYQLALAADVAQERSQKINFLQGDMREMAFEEMFDGVFCWNTTFGYFEEDKNLAVAQRVFRALRPGGMFLIDVLNRDFAAASAPCTVWYEGDSCVCMDDMSVDYISSRLRVKRSIILDDGRTKESLFSLRLYSLHELGKLLHEVGFRVTEASGHLATPGVFFGPNSPRIIMLAQRP